MKAILELLSRDWEVRLSHVFREANGVADFMASLAKGLSIRCHKFQSPPVGISGILYCDRIGIGQNRLVLM